MVMHTHVVGRVHKVKTHAVAGNLLRQHVQLMRVGTRLASVSVGQQ